MFRVLGFVLLTVASTALAQQSFFLERQSFRLAEAALEAGERLTFRTLLAALDSYPLQQYLLFEDLQKRLEQTPGQEVREFLHRFPDTLLARQLRHDWLLHLASTGRWQQFLADYRPQEDNAELDCSHRQALLFRGNETAALDGIQALWLSPTSQPAACDPLFERWRLHGGLSTALIWQRIGLAMGRGNSGLAGYLSKSLPAAERAWAQRWQQVHANPRLILDAERFAEAHPQRHAILLHGLARWGRQDSVSAAVAMDTLRERYRFDPEALGPVAARIAVYLAARGHPSAPRQLAAVPATEVTEEVAEWRVRVALSRQDWQAVDRWLAVMPTELAATPRWQYWRARSLETQGQADAATEYYQLAAAQRDYYGFLAAAKLGREPSMVDRPIPTDTAMQQQLAALGAIQRARELYILGRDTQARREWRDAMDGLDAPALQQAALMAAQWGWHYQGIVTLVAADHWDDLRRRFPLPHQERVMAAASRQGIDPAWVMAVIRQESLFQPQARSPAGARGLMQIMPATGRLIAQELGERFPGIQGLLEPDTSIRFGAYYLAKNRTRLQNNPLLASAAYNAGRGRVLEWLPDSPLPADIWAETIPFRETRRYVQRVMEYTLVYRHRLGRAPGSLLRELATVMPG